MKKHTVLTLAFLIIGLTFCPFAQNIEKKMLQKQKIWSSILVLNE